MSEATKNAAVKTATWGISSSRIRHAPSTARPIARAKPPDHQGQVKTPSEMWTAKSGNINVPGMDLYALPVGLLGWLGNVFLVHEDPQDRSVAHGIGLTS